MKTAFRSLQADLGSIMDLNLLYAFAASLREVSRSPWKWVEATAVLRRQLLIFLAAA